MRGTAWWRWKHLFGWLFGIVGVVLTLITGFELISRFITDTTAVSVAANVYMVAISIVILIVCTYYMYNALRKERYANITKALHSVTHQTRDLFTYIRLMEPVSGNKQAYDNYINNCKIMIGNILDQVTIIFTSLTSTYCRAAIKLTYPKGVRDTIYVYTLTRDKTSRQDCHQRDNKRVARDHDLLAGNSHLAKLFDDEDDHWHFISNDLPGERDYRSTSVTAYQPEFATTPETKKRKWPLPYRSCVTCVIRQSSFDYCLDLRSEVLGFLTVDSESRGVFVEKWDVEVMYTIADALYCPLRAYQDALGRAQAAPGASVAAANIPLISQPQAVTPVMAPNSSTYPLDGHRHACA